MLFNYIEQELIEKQEVVYLTEVASKFTEFMRESGIVENAPIKNLKRKIESNFGSRIIIFNDGKGRVLLLPSTVTKETLASKYQTLKKTLETI